MTQPRSEDSAAGEPVAEKSSAAETAIIKSPMAESAVVKSPSQSSGELSKSANGTVVPSPVHEPVDPDPNQPKSVFVSDIHLGCHHSYAVEFLQFLNQIQPESLYLVGDIIDGRKLKKNWHWPDIYHRILCRLTELGKNGTRIVYTPGNHDSFIRDLMFHMPSNFRLPEIEFVDECIHITESGQKLLVIHGDQFDHHESARGIVSRCTAIVYDWLLWGNKKTTGGKPTETGTAIQSVVHSKVDSVNCNDFSVSFRKVRQVMHAQKVATAWFAGISISRRLYRAAISRMLIRVTGWNTAQH